MDINTQRRMLEIAGMTGVTLTESTKSVIKEGAAQDLVRHFGPLATWVIDTLQVYRDMVVDNVGDDEDSTMYADPKSYEGYLKDMVSDQLGDLISSTEYQRFATEVAGQIAQMVAAPGQGSLDV